MTVALPSERFQLGTGLAMMVHNEVSRSSYEYNASGNSNGSMIPSYDRSFNYKPTYAAAATGKSQYAWDPSTSQVPLLAGPSTSMPTDSEQNSMPLHGQRAMRSSSRRRSSAPPKNSTDALARWFAELVSWIWFSPPSSSLIGASRPMTPVRSPTSSFAPHQSSPLAPAILKVGSAFGSGSLGGEDRFAMLGGSIASNSTTAAPGQSSDSDHQLRRGTFNLAGWPSGLFDDPSSPERRFHPQEKFVAFIRDTIKTTQVSTSVLILALLYVQRLKLQHPKLRGQEGSEYRLSVTAMMLGNKFLDDHTYTNKTWSDISGIPLKDITKMEIEFWLGLQMRIHVHKTDYEAWLQTIDDLFGQRSDALWKREQREIARRKAVAQQASPRLHPATRYSFSNLGFPVSSEVPFAPQSASPQAWNTSNTYKQQPLLTSHDYVAAASPSPRSHYSSFSSAATASSTGSTCATSAAGLTSHDNASRFSPEQRRMSARKLSPLSSSGRPAPANPSFVTGPAPISAPIASGWQQFQELPRLPSASESCSSGSFDDGVIHLSRKRGRDAAEERSSISGGREAKRSAPAETFSFDGYPSRAYSRASSPGLSHHEEHVVPCTHSSRFAATPVSRNGSLSRKGSANLLASASRDEAAYRSIFAEPLTPQCLTQGYVGPHGLSSCLQTNNGEDRGLSFYQLAAGNNPGLPALHLPPPAAYLGGSVSIAASSAGGNNASATVTPHAMAAARRGSLNLANFASPRQSWSAIGMQDYHHHHQSGTQSLVQSPFRSYGYAQPQRPVRHSPEAYGVSYSNPVPPTGPDSGIANGSSANPEALASNGQDQYPAASSNEDRRGRWMPFNNVPMNMQLEQMQQWHHIQHQQQLRAQEEEERRRRSVGCYMGAGRH